jgi:hypothetical protein
MEMQVTGHRFPVAGPLLQITDYILSYPVTGNR